ncbi:MAG: hypothetical protein MUF19_00940 [Candidatus Pacebacteria bacterium]|jgi:hypothetical protein|nr:hypothetical protein [Candidatus Paceibacterota bacterium]
MFRHCSLKAVALVLAFVILFDGTVGQGIVKAVTVWSAFTSPVVDRLYLASQNPNVVDTYFLGNVPTAEAAVDPAEREYHVNVGPITGTATVNYVYGTLFNPVGSGRTLLVKRLFVRSNAVTATNNFVNLSARRVTTATLGTQISAADIPKKNSDTVNPVAEVRHTGVTVSFAGGTDSRMLGQPMAGGVGYEYSNRELTFDTAEEPIVLQPGEGIAVYQEAAGNTGHRVQVAFEWEEVTSAPAAQGEYLLAFPRVEVAAGVNYVYNSLFNPVGSGVTAIVKRVWMGAETCDTTAVYTNNISIKRISAASGGTQVTAANIPKKHTGSSNSAVVPRHTNVTVTQVGGADARLLHITPCGAAGQQHGWKEFNLRAEDEQIILQPGEGIALVTEAAGDIDQFVRMFVEWQEVPTGSTPASLGEYLWSSNSVSSNAALGTTFFTAYNPNASGRTALLKRIVIRVNATNTAAYSTLNFQRISTSTTGTLITAADIPKKHTGTSNSVMQLRWCGATCATAMNPAYVGNRNTGAGLLSDSGIFKALAPGVVGQLHGQNEIVFTPNAPFVLRAGEGIGFYLNYLAGSINNKYKITLEWDEEASPPTAVNEYVIDIGAMPGDIGTSFNYATFFNPSTSTRAAVIKKTAVRVNTINTATHSPIQLKRISASSGGTVIATTDIPRKDTLASTSQMRINRGGVTATYSQSVEAQLLAVQTPAAVAGAAALARMGWADYSFENDGPLVLLPGEGIVLNNNAAADGDHRLYWFLEWEEVATSSVPAATNEYLMTIGPAAGVTTSGHVYATLYNPATSTQQLVVSRVGIRGNRIGALTNPGYIPITLRGVTTASGGTLVAITDIPKKHTSSTNAVAQIRRSGVTASLAGTASSRLFSVLASGAVQQSISVLQKEWIFGDELVLYPGEGIALYQESAAGDANNRYYMTIAWREEPAPVPPQSITFSISDNAIGFGTLLPGGTRYATGNSVGAGTDSAAAHTISVSTNATDGYVMYLSGSTLTCATCGGATVSSVGGTAAAPSVGTEQFGLRATVVSGTGIVSAPYNGANWALDTAAFPDTFATGAGDDVTTDFGIRYMSNIASNSEAGSYTAQLTYIVTSTF